MKKIFLLSITFLLLLLAVVISAASLNITTQKGLPDAIVGEAYSVQIQVSNGTPPYTFSLKNGSFPPGVNFSPIDGKSSNGAINISGTPTKNAAGKPPLHPVVRVIDSSTNIGEKEFEIRTLINQLEITNPSGNSLPPGTVGELYPEFTFTATGGISPYVWSNPETPDGTLLSDLGLQLSSDGKLSGRPIESGISAYKIYIRVVGDPVASFQSGNGVFTSFGLKINSAPFEFITVGFPTRKVGEYFGVTLAAHGGTPPYSWTVAAGSLPPGLQLSNDIISGTPTEEGNFSFSLLLASSEGEELVKPFSITISGVCKENCGPAPGEPGDGSGNRSGPEAKDRRLEIAWPPSPLGTQLQTDSITLLVKYLYEWAIGIGGFLAFISLIIAGVQYLTSAGNATRMGNAMGRIKSAGFGLILLLSAVLVLNVINPQLTELKIIKPNATSTDLTAIKPIDLKSDITECIHAIFYGGPHLKGDDTIINADTGCQSLTQPIDSIEMEGSCQVILYQTPGTCERNIEPVTISNTTENIGAIYGTTNFPQVKVIDFSSFIIKSTE
ncbi:MAG: pilin [Candidatus Nealsonbacteria bacterium]